MRSKKLRSRLNASIVWPSCHLADKTAKKNILNIYPLVFQRSFVNFEETEKLMIKRVEVSSWRIHCSVFAEDETSLLSTELQPTPYRSKIETRKESEVR